MKYLLFDFSNLAHRTFHVVSEKDKDSRRQMIMSGIAFSIFDIYERISPDKCVFVFDSNSWRKKIFDQYKANRQDAYANDLEGQEIIYNVIADYYEFIDEKTDAFALKYPDAECDDLISVFIQEHPEDEIVIASTDTDFYQLISNKVSLYSPVSKNLIKIDKVINSENEEVPFTLDGNGKIKIGKTDGIPLSEIEGYGTWAEWCLYCKIIRGDSSDNVFSAYPGVRVKGNKNKVGILESFKGRKTKDFNYVNFINQTWENLDGEQVLVEDKIEFNKRLIDLNNIDEEYKIRFQKYIKDYESNFVLKPQVGVKLGQFAVKNYLTNVTDNLYAYIPIFK